MLFATQRGCNACRIFVILTLHCCIPQCRLFTFSKLFTAQLPALLHKHKHALCLAMKCSTESPQAQQALSCRAAGAAPARPRSSAAAPDWESAAPWSAGRGCSGTGRGKGRGNHGVWQRHMGGPGSDVSTAAATIIRLPACPPASVFGLPEGVCCAGHEVSLHGAAVHAHPAVRQQHRVLHRGRRRVDNARLRLLEVLMQCGAVEGETETAGARPASVH